MELKKFFIIIFELFIILKLYDVWTKFTGFSMGSYLVIIFLLFWFLNYLLSELTLTRSVPGTFFFKILPRMSFTNQWFGILVAASVVFGFFLSKALVGSAFVTYLIVVLGAIISYKLIKDKTQPQNQDKALLVIGFILGIAIGSQFTSSAFVVTVFILGNIFLYFISEPGEREKGT